MIKNNTLLIACFFIIVNISAQENIKKVELTNGIWDTITYNELNLNTYLSIYDKDCEAHLIGDVSFTIKIGGRMISGFYIDKENPRKQYLTRIYKSTFLTFSTNNNKYYLTIEPASFGKSFALLGGKNSTASTFDDLEIEVVDYMWESGYSYTTKSDYNDVGYYLRLKNENTVDTVHFYSSEINGSYPINLKNYTVTILSDYYSHSTVLIEMIVTKEDKK